MIIRILPMTYKEWENTFGQFTEPVDEVFGIKPIHAAHHLIDDYEVIDKHKFLLATIKYNFPFEIIEQ